MKILIADDDRASRKALGAILEMFGFEVVEAEDGSRALALLLEAGAPQMAILDWMMPGLSGLEVCEQIRALPTERPPSLIMLTMRDTKEDLVAALGAGADDYLAKPCEPTELQARVGVGQRLLSLQGSLADHVDQLQAALDQVRTLRGILPICSYCKKIRNDQRYWEQLEHYISENTGATFSHGICPDCRERHVLPELEAMRKSRNVRIEPLS